jgi:acyl-[acyl-carrier-protein]-phospholipid O-acyltransferase/long-chain-fatty-acid--[acyl-carrier-protein] ligase
MVAGSLFVALLQAGGLPIGWIFFGLAVASFGAVWFVYGKWDKEGVRDSGAELPAQWHGGSHHDQGLA